jgi:hypothetical protein
VSIIAPYRPPGYPGKPRSLPVRHQGRIRGLPNGVAEFAGATLES